MSADRWSHCPACLAAKVHDVDLILNTVEEQYGKLPRHEWEALKRRAEERENEFHLWKEGDESRTFREDYGFINASSGVVSWHYKGRCSQCSLRVEEKRGNFQIWDRKEHYVQ